MKGPVIGIVIVLSLLATGAIFYASNLLLSAPPKPTVQSYTSDILGVSFSYPIGYVLSEKDIGTPDKAHHVITIFHEDDAVPHVNSEGPTAVTLDFYQNVKKESPLDWMTRNAESNFALGDGTYTPHTVDSAEGQTYHWSGLYEGETTAFEHEGNIVAVSVTYLAQSDDIYGAYQSLLASLSFH